MLGFPSNDYGGQEPGSNAEIADFCRATYGVEFPMFAKTPVKGPDKHPLYKALIAAQPKASFKPGSAYLSPLRRHRPAPTARPRSASELREIPDRPAGQRRRPLRPRHQARRRRPHRRDHDRPGRVAPGVPPRLRGRGTRGVEGAAATRRSRPNVRPACPFPRPRVVSSPVNAESDLCPTRRHPLRPEEAVVAWATSATFLNETRSRASAPSSLERTSNQVLSKAMMMIQGSTAAALS